MNWKEFLPKKGPPKKRRSTLLVDYSGAPEVLNWIIDQAELHRVNKSEVVRAIMFKAFEDSKKESGKD